MGNYVLVLNASFEFLNVASLHRALKLVLKGKAEVIEEHPHKEVGTTSRRMKAPLIIRMLYYIIRPFYQVTLTKKNILLRDRYICQYCGKPGNTVDHIIPKSRGGPDSWENCVCACNYCNTKKNNKTPAEANMKLLENPKKPMYISWLFSGTEDELKKWEKYL